MKLPKQAIDAKLGGVEPVGVRSTLKPICTSLARRD